MLKTKTTSKFEKDVKLALKGHCNLKKLYYVMIELVNERKLDNRCCDHALKGNYYLHRECYIEPDWLLIYAIEHETIKFVRTGTHSDLFKK